MHGFWSFDLTLPSPDGNPPDPRRVLVVFCSMEKPDENSLTECIDGYCKKERPPDQIYLIAPKSERDALQAVLPTDKFKRWLREVTRYINTPGADCLLFDECGDLESMLGKLPPKRSIDAIRRRGLTHLVRSYPVFREAQPSHHFAVPSGGHAQYFFRIGSAMGDGAAIDFMAFCCLHLIDAEVRHIYCDTGTIIPVAYAVNALRKRIKPDIPFASVSSFRSYEGLKPDSPAGMFEFRDIERCVILISLTITGGLPAEVQKVHTTIPARVIVSLFTFRDMPKFPNVVCDLRVHRDNPRGFPEFDTHPADNCPLCSQGSACIQIAGEQFLTGDSRVEPLILKAKHSPAWLSPFMHEVVGKNLIRANYNTPDAGHATREVFFDLESLFKDDNLLEIERYQKRFQWALARAIPASLTRIIHIDSPASKAMALMIESKVKGQFSKGIEILAYPAVRDGWREYETDEGATLIVAAAAASGRSLLSVAQLLRRIQKNGAITYLVGLARYPTPEVFNEIESNITYGDQPRDYGFFAVERVNLPLVGSKTQTTWDMEADLLKWLQLECTDDAARRQLDSRAAAIAKAAGHDTKGMLDNLFWAKPDGETLKLRPNFAFYNFEATEQLGVKQADVYFTMAAILHNLRCAREAKESLYPHEHLRRVLSPRCFDRFNDGVIQSSLLRAAHQAEVDYSTDENLSREMWQFLDFVFRERLNEPGEAYREFLVALALGRLRLRLEDTKKLKERHGDTSRDALDLLLWKKIGCLLEERIRCEQKLSPTALDQPSPHDQPASTKSALEKIAILGWGSLLWEDDATFDAQHAEWEEGGPTLKIEFSRISHESREGALTIVIDDTNGVPITVSWSLSRRSTVEEAVEDLRRREKAPPEGIDFVRIERVDSKASEGIKAQIAEWGLRQRLEAVVWTALKSNFEEVQRVPFSVDAAVAYLETLRGPAKEKAVEYLRRARAFVETPLRTAIERSDWFKKLS
jgi:hypothetical protein